MIDESAGCPKTQQDSDIRNGFDGLLEKIELVK